VQEAAENDPELKAALQVSAQDAQALAQKKSESGSAVGLSKELRRADAYKKSLEKI